MNIFMRKTAAVECMIKAQTILYMYYLGLEYLSIRQTCFPKRFWKQWRSFIVDPANLN